MKRQPVIKKWLKLLKENDAVIVSGEGLSKIVFGLDDQRVFYFDKLGRAIPFSIGLAMAINKRVFVICEDIELMRNFSLMAQAASSRCVNLIFVFVGCGTHQDSGGQPNVLSNIKAPKGVLFNMGITVYDFTPHFNDKYNRTLPDVFERLRGPSVALVDVDPGVTNITKVDIDKIKVVARFSEFVQDLELGTSLFLP